MRFGLLGAGRIGCIHGLNVTARGDARLIAVADASAEAASSLAQAAGAKVADATGKIVAETSTERSGEMVIGHTDKLAPGSYWVRLYSGEELLREYGLTVR